MRSRTLEIFKRSVCNKGGVEEAQALQGPDFRVGGERRKPKGCRDSEVWKMEHGVSLGTGEALGDPGQAGPGLRYDSQVLSHLRHSCST